MSVVPIFDSHRRVVLYIGTSGDEKPSGFRVREDALLIETDTVRIFGFSNSGRVWTERRHPDTQAALDRLDIAETENVALRGRMSVLEASAQAMEARLNRIDPPGPS